MAAYLTINSFIRVLHLLTTLTGECCMDFCSLFAKERRFTAAFLCLFFSGACHFQALQIWMAAVLYKVKHK